MNAACMLGMCMALSLVVVLCAGCNGPRVGGTTMQEPASVPVRGYFNLPYDDHPQSRLHLFVPEGTARAPIVVYIHGGGWTGGNLDQYDSHCVQTACQGMAAATIEYRLLDSASLTEIIADVARACAFLQTNAEKYGYDGTRMFLVGSSAGGHLALVVGGRWKSLGEELGLGDLPAPLGVVAQCPVTNLEATADADAGRVRRNQATGGAPLACVSPVHIAAEGFPAVLVQHGDADDLVPQQESLQFVDRLRTAGVSVEFLSMPGIGHAFGYNLSMPAGRRSFDSAMTFIQQRLADRAAVSQPGKGS